MPKKKTTKGKAGAKKKKTGTKKKTWSQPFSPFEDRPIVTFADRGDSLEGTVVEIKIEVGQHKTTLISLDDYDGEK